VVAAVALGEAVIGEGLEGALDGFVGVPGGALEFSRAEGAAGVE
jgi:hypothetical protein